MLRKTSHKKGHVKGYLKFKNEPGVQRAREKALQPEEPAKVKTSRWEAPLFLFTESINIFPPVTRRNTVRISINLNAKLPKLGWLSIIGNDGEMDIFFSTFRKKRKLLGDKRVT